ncbi:DUF6916 family protein [Oleisolibacter albus]|uniref:DUF6916 family protein n=1 Tax=Oleisolibacter albus TaxID=2171757 RepID=UPI000DF28724|nr:hypothetical protein [Oleisolibacter albus]
MPLDLATVTAEEFEPLRGGRFRVCWEGLEETLTLQEIRRLRYGLPGGRSPFALTFKGGSDSILLNQRIHPLQAEGLGDIEIFLVPIGRNDDGTYLYEAVFN